VKVGETEGKSGVGEIVGISLGSTELGIALGNLVGRTGDGLMDGI